MTSQLTYHGRPLSSLYAEYVDKVRADDRKPLPLAEWAHDPAHTAQFRAAFNIEVS